MSRRMQALAGVAVLLIIVWWVDVDPFLAGLAALDSRALLAATLISGAGTVCCAWRWRLVAGGLGVDVPLRAAVSAYYRAQFLNATLPGGIAGEVHRAFRHGVRAVAVERLTGQAAQVVTALILLALLAPVTRPYTPIAATVLIVAGGFAAWAVRARLRPTVWFGVAAGSAAVLCGHILMFLIAARACGLTASWPTLVPLAVAALMAMLLPVQIAGWGPREAVSAWAFAAAGLTAADGVAVAVTYGVMSLAATLPGGVMLAMDVLSRRGAEALR
jgi:uncharacterized membrane protein YbhN (UPF0104 family)